MVDICQQHAACTRSPVRLHDMLTRRNHCYYNASKFTKWKDISTPAMRRLQPGTVRPAGPEWGVCDL